MTRNELIMEALEDMSRSDLVCVWNEYCDANSYYDDRIEFMDSIDDLLCGLSPSRILELANGDFTVSDDYFRETIWGLESFNHPEDHIDLDDLADYILENEDSLYSDDLSSLFESEEWEGAA